MFTVVGSGFGLYGYLPALIEALGEPVILPEAYRGKVEARPELRACLGVIQWVADRDAALAAAHGVVIAMPPDEQPRIVQHCLRLPQLKTLVLEKPLATTPALAADLLEELKRSGRRFRIGYSLLHAQWAAGLHWPDAASDRAVNIDWTFMAHHFSSGRETWKRRHAEGGGVLRFFGVHLLALLARHGYRDVAESVLSGAQAGEPERWSCVFSGHRLPPCRVSVDSRSAENRLRIAAAEPLVDLGEPFALEPAQPGGGDRRIAMLERLLESFREKDREYHATYDAANLLWRKVEAASAFEVR